MPADSLRWPRTHQRASASRRGLSPDHNLGACRTRAAQGLPLTLTPQNRARRALRHVPNYNDSGLAFNRARLEAGANVGAVTARQRATPLHYAAVRGHAVLVDMLARHGADTNASDARGDIPLYAAGRNGHADAVMVLLQAEVRLAPAGGRPGSLSERVRRTAECLPGASGTCRGDSHARAERSGRGACSGGKSAHARGHALSSGCGRAAADGASARTRRPTAGAGRGQGRGRAGALRAPRKPPTTSHARSPCWLRWPRGRLSISLSSSSRRSRSAAIPASGVRLLAAADRCPAAPSGVEGNARDGHAAGNGRLVPRS